MRFAILGGLLISAVAILSGLAVVAISPLRPMW